MAALAATTLASAAMAQPSKRFEGLSAQAGVGIQNSTFKSDKVTVAGAQYQAGNASDIGVPSTFGINYLHAIDSRLLLGVGAEYGFGKLSAGSYNLLGNGPANGLTGSVESRNPVTLSLLGGYALSPRSMLYGKAGYQSSQFGINGHFNSVNGLALGIGNRYLFDDNLFAYGEANYIANNKANFAGPSGSSYEVQSQNYNAILGLGYRF